MAVLLNYVELEDGVPSRFHFRDHALVRKTITDPVTLQPASRNTLVMEVNTLDGQPLESKFSIMAEKLASQFEPYLADKSYRNYDFTITAVGSGFRRSWTVLVTPRSR